MTERNYVTQAECAEYADVTFTDADEADDRIRQAEELIDMFVGAQEKFFPHKLEGLASGGSDTTLELDTLHKGNYPYTNYFKRLVIEIIGGANEGERRVVESSTVGGVLTVSEAFTNPIDTTSFYRIYQIGKFPRRCDSTTYTNVSPSVRYSFIPENVRRAVAAQLQFMIDMGDKFFSTDKSAKTSESIMDYSYSKTSGGGINELIAPKAKMLLRGIKNRTGEIEL